MTPEEIAAMNVGREIGKRLETVHGAIVDYHRIDDGVILVTPQCPAKHIVINFDSRKGFT